MAGVPYSLGDAIDWKLLVKLCKEIFHILFPYSLGDAIDWKLQQLITVLKLIFMALPYSLGDAIDWKPEKSSVKNQNISIPYSLGDAIDWKLNTALNSCLAWC